eukprot:CAMPEP_0172314272 /NCGR_PEP_ID=MMETSP1058-20130122/22113_1 /TAXON_ID=83371 /ORGANISM="Detonula confervacea, Strain CCMP 353" /LENGTH=452 /DNA_ID=CAMNT_0013028095 /DNA_START=126 /DNA_END=1484 /DNA_ORIENTATION=+
MVFVSSTFIAIGYLLTGAQCFSPPSLSSYLAQQRITTSYSNTNNRNYNNAFSVLHVTETTQDEKVSDPASLVFYDDIEDPDNPHGVVCARGICVLPDDDEYDFSAPPGTPEQQKSLIEKFVGSWIGPRLMLAFASILYGTNFPLGVTMNEALVPSAATSARMLFASLALSPFLFKLEPKLAPKALLGGCFVALGYISQSLSLVDTSPAKVAFLGAATVIVCPALEVIVNKKDMSIRNQPQTWLAATLCLLGVAVLELYDPTGATAFTDAFKDIGKGDFLALGQAVGFGTSFVLTESMMTEVPGQALPITACQVSTTAFLCMIWSISDGWIGTAGAESYGVPAMFFEPSLQMAAVAVLWTGLATTALNRFIETTALGRMKSAEASVILATEPLWAALFAALWLKDDFGANDYIGGALIVAACLATALKKDDFRFFFGDGNDDTDKIETEGSFE